MLDLVEQKVLQEVIVTFQEQDLLLFKLLVEDMVAADKIQPLHHNRAALVDQVVVAMLLTVLAD
jgi:hypothetical protein